MSACLQSTKEFDDILLLLTIPPVHIKRVFYDLDNLKFSSSPLVSSSIPVENAPNEQMIVFKVDDTQLTDAQKEYFKQIAGSDMEISWEELKDILDMVIKPEGNNQGYSREVCRSLLALMDVDHSGKLSYQEFNVLWTDVGRWNVSKHIPQH
uniref:EF-hand domain-containing protein n=1 Tax=Timema monikensis TaxID=170555 RepID=A0A7R9EKX9_9NEOP|nr:unnamed protein product [Timema monikensis]